MVLWIWQIGVLYGACGQQHPGHIRCCLINKSPQRGLCRPGLPIDEELLVTPAAKGMSVPANRSQMLCSFLRLLGLRKP